MYLLLLINFFDRQQQHLLKNHQREGMHPMHMGSKHKTSKHNHQRTNTRTTYKKAKLTTRKSI